MINDIKLTNLTKSSGCAAKIGPATLESVLKNLPKFNDNNLIVGFDKKDDACVYKIGDENVLIQTVDFFPPMVDDPYIFGQIAATNALSDIYAMGGDPAIAMNLLCFPSCLDKSIMSEILSGGYNKVQEAGAFVVGGHTIADPIPKYGLCVSGFANKNKILTNSNSKTGDVIVLTKPIGLGVLNTASKAELLNSSESKEITDVMTMLNKYAKECLNGLRVNACTDITGFGLIGHAYEMADGSNKTIEISSEDIPILPKALEYAKIGVIPEGMYNNLEYLKDKFKCLENISDEMRDVLLDPQTSGGLLLSMPEEDAKKYLSRMEYYTNWTKIIGQVYEKSQYDIVIK